MKKLIQIMLVAASFLIDNQVRSQGTIVSVVPNSAASNTSVDMVIRGAGTNFSSSSTISIGGNVIVPLNKLVPDPETIKLKFDVNLPVGDHTLTIATGNQIVSSNFKVFEPGSALNVMVNVMPLQSINVSDFDPANLGNSPVLFTVTIFNDNNNRQNLRAVLTLTGDNYGPIGEATKTSINVAPNATLLFSNKEFNTYNVSSKNSNFFDKAVKTGTLPADVYSYVIDLYDDKGVKLGTGIGKNVIFNQISKPELISPGGDFNKQAEALRVKQPLFQWFSQGNDFEIALYPINTGQTTAEEVVLNRPIFIQKSVKSTSFQYPGSAEMLEEGKTYAWQIKMNAPASNGLQQLASEVFWFKYTASGAVQGIVSDIKITPEDCYVQVNQIRQFSAVAYTASNEPVNNPVFEWKVVPADMGTIDKNGLFIAAGKTGSCAVIAKGPGDVQEYATVNITTVNLSDWTMKMMLQKLFGLPAEK